ncbi:hypothetical protein VNI00_010686 [Paramarasmius palmivorus]|uniref:Uncharacterized protein n=1 Tax=Paramarasmius palmivorus TaxID=297713 RepID=A0AAW0CJB8_9AGAR
MVLIDAGQADEDARFQKLRERYDMISSMNKNRVEELRVANKKIRTLQEEIDLLLEAFIEGSVQTPLIRFEAPPPPPAPAHLEEPRDPSWRPSPLPQPLPQPGSGSAALLRAGAADAPIHPHALPDPSLQSRAVANGKRVRSEMDSPEDDKSKRRRRVSRKRSPGDDSSLPIEGDADSKRMAFISELIDP